MIRAIFFDLDDTLYDHLTPFKQAIASIVHHDDQFPYEAAYHRMRFYSDKLSVEYGGADVMAQQGTDKKMQAERFMYTLAEFSIPLTLLEAEQVQSAYLAMQFQISIFPKMADLITRLKQNGYIVGLLSNGESKHQRKKIEALNLHDYIAKDLMYISSEVGIDKPNPKIFQYISDQINVKSEECLYIGDSWRNDVIGAREANWHIVWFNHRNVVSPDPMLVVDEVTSLDQLYSYLTPFLESVIDVEA